MGYKCRGCKSPLYAAYGVVPAPYCSAKCYSVSKAGKKKAKEDRAISRYRAIVRAKNGGYLVCEYSGIKGDTKTIDVHHIIPRSKAPSAPWLHKPENLVCLHHKHHRNEYEGSIHNCPTPELLAFIDSRKKRRL